MSVARHLDALSVYQATAIRIVPIEGVPEDLIGQDPLVEVLRDPSVSSILLGDRDLEIEARREGPRGRLVVRWSGETVVEELLDIPALVPPAAGPQFCPDHATLVRDLVPALHASELPLYGVADLGGTVRWYTGGHHGRGVGALPLRASIPPVDPRSLGSAAFREAHGVELAYVAGAAAGGIGSVNILAAMASAGMMGFFGAGGLPIEVVERALREASERIVGAPYGFNLLHNPVEPTVEERTVDLYLEHGVRRVSASAYMNLTPAIVRYRLTGIHRSHDGRIVCPNHVFAKVSREEVAERFLRPAPAEILEELHQRGVLDAEQVELARLVPVAEDITAEADSGGHTDRRPLLVLLPALQRLRDRIVEEQGYALRDVAPRIGAAGGLGTPSAVWAAFAMGADYVLTGSVNQASPEAGTSRAVKEMLAGASYTDVATGPAPDMFELGAHVQVLSRGSMYAQRATRLHELYKRHDSLEAIPAADRARIEKQIFRRPLAEVWDETVKFWQGRDPAELERAARDPRHKMALTFRWYLGLTSRWARIGDAERKRDYQIWCGPAMGAFNAWVAGSALEDVDARGVAVIADVLMRGAAAMARVSTARVHGVKLPSGADAVPVQSLLGGQK